MTQPNQVEQQQNINDISVENQQEMYKMQQMTLQLPRYVQGCYSDHPATQFECVQRIRKLLAINFHEPPIKQVIDSGVVGRLVQFLQFEQFPRLQFEATWILTNIAAGTSEQTATVIRYGSLPLLVWLLTSKSDEVKEQSIWALGNIAGDSTECRNLVLSYGALTKLSPIFRTSKEYQICLVAGYMAQQFLTRSKNYQYGINMIIVQYLCKPQVSILRMATWTLKGLCQGTPSPDLKYVQLAIKILAIMIKSEDEEIVQDTCWAFTFLSNIHSKKEEQQIKMIIDSGCLDVLINLMDHKSAHVVHPALMTIGNIIAECEQYTQKMINLGVLKKLHHLMQHKRPVIKREVCWIVSNIISGSKNQIEAVIKANLFQPLIHILTTEKYETSKKALCAISNATYGGSDTQISVLVNQGVVAPLCQFFRPQKCPSNRIMLIALEGIENILAVGHRASMLSNDECNQFARNVEKNGGVEYLEQLISNPTVSNEIYNKATSIIKQYFNTTMIK